MTTSRGSQTALRALSERLQAAAPEIWLGYGRVVLQCVYPSLAAALLERALARQPASVALRYWLSLFIVAGCRRRTGRIRTAPAAGRHHGCCCRHVAWSGVA